MGGEQSCEEETEEREDEDEEHPESDDASEGELPQCRMGNRKVDDMCFMISCTNWY